MLSVKIKGLKQLENIKIVNESENVKIEKNFK